MSSDLKPHILFIVTEAKFGLILITDDMTAVNWFVAHDQFLIVKFLDILEILLLLNLSVIFIHAEGGYEGTEVLLAYIPCQPTDTFYD